VKEQLLEGPCCRHSLPDFDPQLPNLLSSAEMETNTTQRAMAGPLLRISMGFRACAPKTTTVRSLMMRGLIFCAVTGGLLVSSFAWATPLARSPADVRKECVAQAESGQQLRASGRILAAREHFDACQAVVCPQVIRNDCARWQEELVTEQPSILVLVKDQTGADVSDAEVTVDGVSIPLRGQGVPVDPGPHLVRATRGESTAESRIVVVVAVKLRPVELRLFPPPTSVRASAPPAAPVPKAVVVAPPPPPTFGPQRYLSVLSIAVGAAGVGIGSVLGARYNRAVSKLGEQCGYRGECSATDVDSLPSRIPAYAFVGGGVALVATGALLFAFGRPNRPAAYALIPHMGGATFEGRF